MGKGRRSRGVYMIIKSGISDATKIGNVITMAKGASKIIGRLLRIEI